MAGTPTVMRDITAPSPATATVPSDVTGTYAALAKVAGTPAPAPTATVQSAVSAGTGNRTSTRTVARRLRVLARPTERTRSTCVPGSSASE